MKESLRRQRAMLRDRRRDNRDEALYGTPLFRALTGWDLYIISLQEEVAAASRHIWPGHGVHVNRCTHERSCD